MLIRQELGRIPGTRKVNKTVRKTSEVAPINGGKIGWRGRERRRDPLAPLFSPKFGNATTRNVLTATLNQQILLLKPSWKSVKLKNCRGGDIR